MSGSELETIIDKFNVLTHKPTKFLSVQKDAKEDFKYLVKSLYDFTKSSEKCSKKSSKCALPELIVQDFDEEQLWQQIELQNTECWDQLVWDVASCMTNKSALEFPVTVKEDSESEVSEQEEVEHESENEISEEEINPKNSTKKKNQPKGDSNKKPKGKPSIVDDKFFKLRDMEQFLLKEERNDGKPTDPGSDSESIDLFDEIDDEDSENEEDGLKKVMYGDFFQNDNEFEHVDNQDEEISEKLSKKKEKKKKVTFIDEPMDSADEQMGSEEDEQSFDDKNIPEEASSGDDDDDSNKGDPKPSPKPIERRPDEKQSEFEQRQQRLKQTIDRLEAKTLSEAPWQLKGEVDALKRPQNSLLENFVDFDLTTRPAPIITEQTTLTLEEIIKQRVKDKAWDDVEKKEKPVDDQLAFRKTEVLDMSKSKQSLAQVYEAEYLKQKQALTDDNGNEKEPENQKEVREAIDKLFAKLDALCHYHYTPKPAQPEVRIVSNTPAIMMEEVAPVSISDATLLAPEEIKRKRKGDLMSKEERTDTDKKRERRKKKVHQSKKGKVAKVTEHRNTKKAEVSGDQKSLKTSKAFFQQLNDDTTSLIKSKRNIKNKGQ